jgi:hypothetical protein
MPRTSSDTVAGTSRAVRERSQLQRALSTPTAPLNAGGAPGGSGFTRTRTGWLRTTSSWRGTRPLSHCDGSFEPGCSSSSLATASPTVCVPLASGYRRVRVSVTSTRELPSAA